MGLWTDAEQRNGAGYEWLHSPARPAPPSPPAPPAPPRPRRRWPVYLLVALAVAALAAVATVAVTKDDGPAQGRKAVAPLSVSSSPTGRTRINQIYSRVSASVVNVEVKTPGGAATGSGFVIAGDGTIVTNDHVVQDATQVAVRFDDHSQPVPAKVEGTDPSSDLAVITVDPGRAPALKPLTLADSKNVAVGDNAIAIGFPLGLDRTATAGIISGLGRTIQAPNNFTIDNVLQTDAPINPGNSGGPLLDDRGRVIGVNSQIATAGSQGNVGIGFAVPSNTIRAVVPRLEKGQHIRRAYLGVSTSDATGAVHGAAIGQITPGGPAERAGLRAPSALSGSGGDIITAINGQAVPDSDTLSAIIGKLKPGDHATVTYVRGGKRQTTSVTLAERPAKVAASQSIP
jgi:putative serine protease PepD